MAVPLEELELDKSKEVLQETYCSTCKDTFKQNFSDQGLKEPLRRLILVGKLKYSERSSVRRYHEEMVSDIQKNIMDESSKITGLMIVQKSYFYHVLEGSDEALNEVIETTASFVRKNIIYGAKVVRFTTISVRYFEVWNICVIINSEYTDSPYEESFTETESDVLSLARMIQKFEDVVFVLASYVRYLKQSELDEKINDLVPTSVLPFGSELESLYREPFFLKVEEYVETYLLPYCYISYTEQEWPPTGPVHDATDLFSELDRFEKYVDDTLKLEEEQKKKRF